MSRFVSVNGAYNVCTDNEVSVILSHIESDYVIDVVKNSLKQRFLRIDNIITPPNIVNSWEQFFKQLLLRYTADEDQQNIKNVREQTYKEIIGLICEEFNLQFNDQDIEDYYSPAFYLYDLFISNFGTYLILFYSNYIIKEKNGIYDSMGLIDYKKKKDTSTLYNKKIFKNNKLAVIISNLDYVINNMCAFDISFDMILNTVYQDKYMIKFIQNIVSPRDNFYQNQYVPLLRSDLRPNILSNIRLNIQYQQTMVENIDITC